MIRRFYDGEADLEALERAITVIKEYRSGFGAPMVKFNNGLRYYSSKCGVKADVTQRLKREATIIDKLSDRERGLDLSRMQDIGGLRAVVDTIDDLRRFENELDAAWPHFITDRDDYIKSPRKSGYRALHLKLLRDGLPIEVQLRTRRMHEWAEFVERLSMRLRENFKQDAGEHPVQVLARLLSEVYRREEEGDQVDADLIDRVNWHIREVNKLLSPHKTSEGDGYE